MAENNVVELHERFNRFVEQERSKYSGGNPPGGNMEARVAKLEATVEHIQTDIADIKVEMRGMRGDMRTDFRVVWAGLIALGLGLAGLMAKGFQWL